MAAIITDLNGKWLAEVNADDGLIDITALENGVYLVTMVFDRQSMVQKMIKI